jgi:hypothetical protein
MLRKALLAFVVSAITLLVLDVALRFVTNSPIYQVAVPETPLLSRYHANASAEERTIGDLGVGTASRDDDEPRHVATHIDQWGFRNDADAGTRPVDLVVLGDSFAFGVNTTQAAILPSRLRDRFGFAPYNLSMPWTGPWAQFINLATESRRLTLKPGGTILWVLFSGNDLDDRFGDLDPGKLPRSGAMARFGILAKRFRNRSPIYQMARRAAGRTPGSSPESIASVIVPVRFANGRTMLFLKPYADAAARSQAEVTSHANFGALQRTIDAGRELAGRLNQSLKIVLAPSKEEVYGWALDAQPAWSSPAEPSGFAAALASICAGAGIPFLDLKPAFVAASKTLYEQSGELLWWYDDTHWNGHGHDLAATVIQRELLGQSATPGESGR